MIINKIFVKKFNQFLIQIYILFVFNVIKQYLKNLLNFILFFTPTCLRTIFQRNLMLLFCLYGNIVDAFKIIYDSTHLFTGVNLSCCDYKHFMKALGDHNSKYHLNQLAMDYGKLTYLKESVVSLLMYSDIYTFKGDDAEYRNIFESKYFFCMKHFNTFYLQHVLYKYNSLNNLNNNNLRLNLKNSNYFNSPDIRNDTILHMDVHFDMDEFINLANNKYGSHVTNNRFKHTMRELVNANISNLHDINELFKSQISFYLYTTTTGKKFMVTKANNEISYLLQFNNNYNEYTHDINELLCESNLSVTKVNEEIKITDTVNLRDVLYKQNNSKFSMIEDYIETRVNMTTSAITTATSIDSKIEKTEGRNYLQERLERDTTIIKKNPLVIVLSVLSAALFIAFLVLAIVKRRKNRNRVNTNNTNNERRNIIEEENSEESEITINERSDVDDSSMIVLV